MSTAIRSRASPAGRKARKRPCVPGSPAPGRPFARPSLDSAVVPGTTQRLAMNPTDPRPTDEQLGALLAAAGKDAPPPDRTFLERLRDQSTEAFLAATPCGQLA